MHSSWRNDKSKSNQHALINRATSKYNNWNRCLQESFCSNHLRNHLVPGAIGDNIIRDRTLVLHSSNESTSQAGQEVPRLDDIERVKDNHAGDSRDSPSDGCSRNLRKIAPDSSSVGFCGLRLGGKFHKFRLVLIHPLQWAAAINKCSPNSHFARAS